MVLSARTIMSVHNVTEVLINVGFVNVSLKISILFTQMVFNRS